jgi:hypothetical protein
MFAGLVLSIAAVRARLGSARKAALLRACRRRYSLHFLWMMLRCVLRRLVVDGLFQRLNLVLMFLGRVARGRLRALW